LGGFSKTPPRSTHEKEDVHPFSPRTPLPPNNWPIPHAPRITFLPHSRSGLLFACPHTNTHFFPLFLVRPQLPPPPVIRWFTFPRQILCPPFSLAQLSFLKERQCRPPPPRTTAPQALPRYIKFTLNLFSSYKVPSSSSYIFPSTREIAEVLLDRVESSPKRSLQPEIPPFPLSSSPPPNPYISIPQKACGTLAPGLPPICLFPSSNGIRLRRLVILAPLSF